MNSHEEPQATRKEKSRTRVWLELAGAVCVILTAFAGASIWLFQNVSDKAVARAVLPMKLERLEQTSKEHETRLAEVERKAQASEIDRAQIHKEMAESRAAFTAQIRELFEQLQKRLDRLDDKADRIGERVGVVPRSKFDTRPAFMPAFRQYPPAVATVGAIQYATDAGDFAAHERFRYNPEELTLFVDKLRLPGGANEIRMYTGDVLMNNSQRLNLVEGTALTFGPWRDLAPDVGFMRTAPGNLRVTDGGTGLGALEIAGITLKDGNSVLDMRGGRLENLALLDHLQINYQPGDGWTPGIWLRAIGTGQASITDTAGNLGRLDVQDLSASGKMDVGSYVHLNDWGSLYFGNDVALQRPTAGTVAISDNAGGYGALIAGTVATSQIYSTNNLYLVGSGGTVGIAASNLEVQGGKLLLGTASNDVARFASYSVGNTRLFISGVDNVGFGLQIGESLKFSNAVYRVGSSGNFNYTIWNEQLNSAAFYIDGNTNFFGLGTLTPYGPLDVWASGSQRIVVTPEGHVNIGGACFWNNGTSMLPGTNQFGNRGTIQDGGCFMPKDGAFGFTDGDYTHNSTADTFLRRIAAGALGTDGTFTVGNLSNNVRLTNGCIFTTNEYGNRWQMVDHGASRLGLADSSGTNYDGGALELGIGGGKSAICGGAGGIGFLSFWTGSDYTHPAMQIGADKRLYAFGDVITPTATTGPVLTDRTTGNRWRLKVDSGTLGIELAP